MRAAVDAVAGIALVLLVNACIHRIYSPFEHVAACANPTHAPQKAIRDAHRHSAHLASPHNSYFDHLALRTSHTRSACQTSWRTRASARKYGAPGVAVSWNPTGPMSQSAHARYCRGVSFEADMQSIGGSFIIIQRRLLSWDAVQNTMHLRCMGATLIVPTVLDTPMFSKANWSCTCQKPVTSSDSAASPRFPTSGS